MKYSLLIKSIDGEWSFADLGEAEDGIPFSFQSNDIASLEDRNSNFSYTIELPKTELNNRIFDLSGSPFNKSSVPYSVMDCRVYVDGVEIVKDGKLYLDSVTDVYSVQILSGITDFFDKLKEIDFSTWRGLGDYVRPMTVLSPPEYCLVDNFYIDVNKQRTNTYRNSDGLLLYAFPTVKLGAGMVDESYLKDGIISAIFQELGYMMETDLDPIHLTSQGFSIISLKNQEGVKPFYYEDYDGFYNPEFRPGDYFYGTAFNRYFLYPELVENANAVKTNVEGFAGFELKIKKNIYESYMSQEQLGASFAGSKCYISYTDNTSSEAKELSGFVYDNMGFYVSRTNIELDTTKTYDHLYVVIYVADVGAYIPSGETETIRGVIFESMKFIYEITQEKVPIGCTLTLPNNLGFKDAEECFKTFLQLFGLTIQVDGERKVVKAYTFNHIIDNKANAKDWTDKMDMSQAKEVRFTIGEYAQKSYILFKEYDDYVDKSALSIPNQSLELEKDLFTINIESSKDRFVVPYYDFSSESENESESGVDKTVEFQELGASHFIEQGYNFTTEDVVRGYYSQYRNALASAFVLTAYFLLTAIDIAEFDVFTPIYLKQYGRYFYVNKIDSWQSGKTCKVELIGLPF